MIRHEADRHNEFQPLLGFLKVSKLARPDHAITAGELYILGDARLRLGHGAPEVAVPRTLNLIGMKRSVLS